jgi:hypothetical protein
MDRWIMKLRTAQILKQANSTNNGQENVAQQKISTNILSLFKTHEYRNDKDIKGLTVIELSSVCDFLIHKATKLGERTCD